MHAYSDDKPDLAVAIYGLDIVSVLMNATELEPYESSMGKRRSLRL